MKILYIHQYFKTPAEGGCVRSYHLAKGLVDQGHEVTMVTTHNIWSGLHQIDGLQVHYLQVPYANRFGFMRRIWSYLRYVVLAKRKIASLKTKFDLAYVMTTPLTTGLIALHLKERYNLPYYFEVGDLWPEAPIKMGAIRNGLLKNLLYRFEKKCYFEAQKVIALSPAIRNYIEANSPETKVHVVPNFADVSFFEANHKIQRFSAENPLKVGYIGTFGAANHLDYLLDAARVCQEQKLPVVFDLMGDGAHLKRIKRLSRQLDNLTLHTFGSADAVKHLLESQDAVYVSFKNLEILNTGSPNKFFDGLAAGKLIMINFGGWIRQIVEEQKCGFYHDPLDPTELARKLSVFLKEPEMLYQYQKNARALAEKYYSKELQVQKLGKILTNQKHLSVSDSEVYILTA